MILRLLKNRPSESFSRNTCLTRDTIPFQNAIDFVPFARVDDIWQDLGLPVVPRDTIVFVDVIDEVECGVVYRQTRDAYWYCLEVLVLFRQK